MKRWIAGAVVASVAAIGVVVAGSAFDDDAPNTVAESSPTLDVGLPTCAPNPGTHDGSTPAGPYEPGDPGCDARHFAVETDITKYPPPGANR